MKKYNVVVEREGFSFYIVHCPQLKGCTAEGDTVEGALLAFSDALNVYMKSVIKHEDRV